MNSDKESLRKRLLQMESHRNKLKGIKEGDNKRPQSAPPVSAKPFQNGSIPTNSLPKHPPQVAPKPKLPKILSRRNSKEPPPVPPKPRSRTSSTSSVTSQEAEDIINAIETVNICGIEVPLDVRSMKQRIKEEIQIATATRRLKIDEMEEVRIMERKLADREKIRRLRSEDEARKKAKHKQEEAKEKECIKKLEYEIKKQRDIERQLDKERMEAESKALADKYEKAEKDQAAIMARNKYLAANNASLTLTKMSPQASPRRGKHRRQNSDPMLAKFSPIEERDIENDMSYRLGLEARKLSANLSRFSPQLNRRGLRPGSATPPGTGYTGFDYPDYHALMKGSLLTSGRSKSSEILTMIDKECMLGSSSSETNIPMSMSLQRSRTHHFPLEEDKLSKAEKRQQLQIEIEKRRKALEENARLRQEIQKLTEAANISAYDFEETKSKYKQHVQHSGDYTQTGIIRPLNNREAEHNRELMKRAEFSAKDYSDYTDMMQRSAVGGKTFPQPSYSSTEYIAHHHHRNDRVQHHPQQQQHPQSMKVVPDGSGGGDVYFLQPPGECIGEIYHIKGLNAYDLEMIEKLGYQHAIGLKNTIQGFAGSRDSGMSSGSNMMDPYMPIKPDIDISALPTTTNDSQSEASVTTTDTTPPSLKDATPAMPILDDVTIRSRSKLRQIGSRPLSDDLGQYLDVTGSNRINL